MDDDRARRIVARRRTSRYGHAFGPPTTRAIRDARDYLITYGMPHAPETHEPVLDCLNRILWALESGKHVLVPRSHEAEDQRLTERLALAEAEMARLKAELKYAQAVATHAREPR